MGNEEHGDVKGEAEFDLSSPELYLNRELTWLEFNSRVLHEANDDRNPLLERVKFVAINDGTLDEFFMKRIGGLKQQVGAGLSEPSVDGLSPLAQIEACRGRVREIETQQGECWRVLRQRLREQHEICVVDYSDLTSKQKAQARQTYIDDIFPLVTPQAVDPAHPFPFISNLSLNLLVMLRFPKSTTQQLLARIKVPVGGGIPRFLPLGDGTFLPLEQVLAENLDLLFPDMEVETCLVFRVTRNANTESDEEEADDLMAMIETELRERRFAPIVRLEVSPQLTDELRGMLIWEFGLDDDDVIETEDLLGLSDLFELTNLFPGTDLHNPPHHPIDHPRLTKQQTKSFFRVIRDQPVLVHHPYESFGSSVERFLGDASKDPRVRAIKMTLYRTSAASPVVQHLLHAARNGKQVAVVVEIKARFDEAANIRWAQYLEEAGIHVTYGVVGLKTHCKVILVVRSEKTGLRRYVHIGTGNYHSGTARLYTDLGVFTSDEDCGADATELFNYLTTGYKPQRNYRKLLVAPKLLKPRILAGIEREIEHAKAGSAGLLGVKMNALEDMDVARALYKASMAGVKCELIVRDTCRLRPGIEGLSENIRVISIVGRFLEHARIVHFHNNGDDEYYIGSADLMKRNLESRVEVLVPVEDKDHREVLSFILESQLADTRSAWLLQPDGTYSRRQAKSKSSQGVQQKMIKWAEQRHHKATRLKKRKTRTLGKRRRK